MLEIIDNVFDEKTVDFLYKYYRNQSPWHFTGTGSTNTNWRKFYRDLNRDSKEDKILFDKAEEIFNIKLPHLKKTHILRRSYASGYVFGTHHEMHRDGDCYTIMFYLNKIWTIPYAGETIFTDNEETEIISSIIPKPGRVIIFHGQIPHCAREVSRTCVELRMVATFKYYKKEDNE